MAKTAALFCKHKEAQISKHKKHKSELLVVLLVRFCGVT
jgi:hypothetical protein